MVSALLNDLEISHLNTGHGEIRNLKFNLNRDTKIVISLFILDCWETKRGTHVEFFSAWELLDYPNHARFVWYVFYCSDVSFENRRININWYWNNDLYIVSYRFLFELSASFNNILNLAFCEILNGGCTFNQWLYVGIYSVRHQFEFSIWRDEGD